MSSKVTKELNYLHAFPPHSWWIKVTNLTPVPKAPSIPSKSVFPLKNIFVYEGRQLLFNFNYIDSIEYRPARLPVSDQRTHTTIGFIKIFNLSYSAPWILL